MPYSGRERKNMTMNKKDVRSVLVKSVAGLVLAFLLICATVPAAFATEEDSAEQTTEQTTEAEQSTEAETDVPEQGEQTGSLTDDQIKALAELLSGNDLARQLFMAAAGYNTAGEDTDGDGVGDGQYLKYTANEGKYLDGKGEFSFDTTLSIADGFTAVQDWTEIETYALQILKDAASKSKNSVSVPETLTAEDAEAIVAATQTSIDLENKGGFFDAILRGIGYVLGLMTKYLTFGTNNYILSLLYFGLIVELLMIPMAISQQKNMLKQARLRPKEMAIRRHYAGRNDQATMQKVTQEIQELYQKENYSPFSGCLPLLIQLPIVIALYQVVIDPAFYVLGQAKAFSGAIAQYFTTSQAAGGFGGVLNSDRGTIEILSRLRENGIEAFESLKTFGYFSNSGSVYDALHTIAEEGIPSVSIGSWNFGLTPWSAVTGGGAFFASHWWLLLVPVLTFVVYFASMKINRKLSYQPTTAENDKATGCSNNMMDIMMPMMSVYIAFIVPAAIGVYWMFKSVLTTLKQLVMKKVMPLPVFTEEDYKAAEKEMYGKHPAKTSKASSGTRNPNVRSLHHIDDDEYDSKGNYIGRPETTEDEGEKTEKNEKSNKKAPAMAEPLKDESDKHTKNDATEDKNS